MRVRPISSPLRGERVVAVSPQLEPDADPGWRRRLNLYTGRSLSHAALGAEQAGRSGRLALRGQAVSHGVVSGLEVAVETTRGADGRPASFLRVAPGLGLAASGEDVAVPQPRRIALAAIPVIAPVLPPDGPPPEPARLLDPGGPPLARAQGATLGERLAAGEDLPPVGILVLRPVAVEQVGQRIAADACEPDPDDLAFADRQLVDGCILALYAWPTDWMLLPPPDGRWRNALAYAVYDAARAAGPRPLPWEEYGVPIGLLAFEYQAADGGSVLRPRFIDRHAVARLGGRPRRRTPLVANAGDGILWQARIQQLVEQLADGVASGLGPAALAAQLRYLPPAGLLPADAIDPGGQINRFFPSYYTIEAAPAPIEQLDAMIEASAGLMAYDTQAPDHVQVLVPVPQRVYEPRLLIHEEPDPAFARAIAAAVGRRSHDLRARAHLRLKLAALGAAADGAAPAFPPDADDPGRLEDEGDYLALPFTWPFGLRTQSVAGLHRVTLDFGGPQSVGEPSELFAYVFLDPESPPRQVMIEYRIGESWEHRAYWGASHIEVGAENTDSRRFIGPLPEAGAWVRLRLASSEVGFDGGQVAGLRLTLFDGRVAWGPVGGAGDGEQSWLDEDDLGASPPYSFENDQPTVIRAGDLLAPFEEPAGTSWVDSEVPRLRVTAIEELRAWIAEKNAAGIARGVLTSDPDGKLPAGRDWLAELGLARFIERVAALIDRADDTVNFNFLRVQTDIYRVRQLMLGNTEGSRLAVSPALASIAQGVTATATQEQIQTFFKDLRTQSAVTLGAALAGEPPTLGAGVSDFGKVSFSGISASELLVRDSTFTRGAETNLFLRDELLAQADVSLRKETAPGVFAPPQRESKPIDIIGQSPLVGQVDIRTTTIAERVEAPKAPEARDFSLSGKYDLARGLRDDIGKLGIDLGDIEVPGVPVLEGDQPKIVDGKIVRESVRLRDLAGAAIERIKKDPPPERSTDEAGFFYRGVDLLDHSVVILRQVERTVAGLRLVLNECQRVYGVLRGHIDQVGSRLSAVADALAEARQDVAVARTLLAEEEARLGAINDRRRSVLAEHVRFLAYCRPRVADTLAPTPSRPLDPGGQEAPVPACLAGRADIPAELHELAGMLREAPARWLPAVDRLLSRLDRVDRLAEVVRYAGGRAQLIAASTFARPAAVSAGLFAGQLTKVMGVQMQVLSAYRSQTARVDPARLAGLSWQNARDEASGLLSVGDLIDGAGGRSDVARLASVELDQLLRVAACLHAELAAVPPAIRLVWAERLGQYDGPVNLRNLAGLPRWGEIGLADRRQMQTLVDWLYQRVRADEADAVALINDLVRVCVLLASHAPVSRIVAGAVARETALTEGRRIELSAIDPARVRVGMRVQLFHNAQIVAQGVVEDLRGGQASARVDQLLGAARSSASFTLAAGARAQFTDAAPTITQVSGFLAGKLRT